VEWSGRRRNRRGRRWVGAGWRDEPGNEKNERADWSVAGGLCWRFVLVTGRRAHPARFHDSTIQLAWGSVQRVLHWLPTVNRRKVVAIGDAIELRVKGSGLRAQQSNGGTLLGGVNQLPLFLSFILIRFVHFWIDRI
jgi:hypothetical protein